MKYFLLFSILVIYQPCCITKKLNNIVSETQYCNKSFIILLFTRHITIEYFHCKIPQYLTFLFHIRYCKQNDNYAWKPNFVQLYIIMNNQFAYRNKNSMPVYPYIYLNGCQVSGIIQMLFIIIISYILSYVQKHKLSFQLTAPQKYTEHIFERKT